VTEHFIYSVFLLQVDFSSSVTVIHLYVAFEGSAHVFSSVISVLMCHKSKNISSV
jgi:hypothetical protein